LHSGQSTLLRFKSAASHVTALPIKAPTSRSLASGSGWTNTQASAVAAATRQRMNNEEKQAAARKGQGLGSERARGDLTLVPESMPEVSVWESAMRRPDRGFERLVLQVLIFRANRLRFPLLLIERLHDFEHFPNELFLGEHAGVAEADLTAGFEENGVRLRALPFRIERLDECVH
jgi:hypothetical protein